MPEGGIGAGGVLGPAAWISQDGGRRRRRRRAARGGVWVASPGRLAVDSGEVVGGVWRISSGGEEQT